MDSNICTTRIHSNRQAESRQSTTSQVLRKKISTMSSQQNICGGLNIVRLWPTPQRLRPFCFKSNKYVAKRSLRIFAQQDVKNDQVTEDLKQLDREISLVGEDAALFKLEEQKPSAWRNFFIILGVVLGIMYVIWMSPQLGVADEFLGVLQSIGGDPQVVMLELLGVFAVIHSGLAYLRPQGEELIGARGYRVLFASISLPLATLALFYFINHRYDGFELWNLRGVPGVHTLVWCMNFISFYFLYPSTFNLLEVAAVDKPQLHLWETGVIRITRHPQAFGQLLWCFGHLLWTGNSFVLAASLGLLVHHAFGCFHGDLRLKRKYGDKFDDIAQRTSIIPFAAIIQGRQKIPKDYWKEWVRVPYAVVTIFTLGAYWAHPYMQQAAYWLNW
eukprot:TRINITY_DN5111_c0_g1_i1.p1 TRINITY_DN5111_c0_g1~~TRINITY_DN5111_c0_g1_i1.p1  ORF type:complete len:388 (+),score=22.86 TRINITY_DN5111_c0_g1_i1:176-1339(+)